MFSNDKFIDIHTHQTTISDDTISILNINYRDTKPENGIFSCGIHPWHINEHPLTESLPILMQACSNPNTIALGETGLDRVIGIPFETQEKYFKAQITISEFYKKPMILHCVKAYADIQGIRKAGNYKMPWILHGFNANKQTADQLIKMNFYLSFGKELLDSESKAAQTFPLIPIKNIFLETDNSNLSIKDLYEIAAQLRKMTVETLKSKITENAHQCFK